MASAPHGHDAHDDAHGIGHAVPISTLVITGMVLIGLTVLTVAARYVDFHAFNFPDLNIAVAMGIAVVKASIVCLIFMHLLWDRPFNGIVLVCSMAFVGLMISFLILDTNQYEPEIKAYDQAVLADYESAVTTNAEVKAAKDRLKKLQERLDAEPAPAAPANSGAAGAAR
ncbi:MAG: cytochrome C oxidase subunit IV family protein [Phycisphaerales bacterium]|nr:cytochrome C oxidase subunit IV family protein [Phycisphaerales bacterium]